MKYEWAILIEREDKEQIDGGTITNNRTIRKSGTIIDELGQNAIKAILEKEWNTGNVVQFEIRTL